MQRLSGDTTNSCAKQCIEWMHSFAAKEWLVATAPVDPFTLNASENIYAPLLK